MEEQKITDSFPQTPLTNREPANATDTLMESSTMTLESNVVNGMKLESADGIGVKLEFDGDESGVKLESDGDEHGVKLEYEENGSGAAKEGLKETDRFPVYPARVEYHILIVAPGQNILRELLVLSQSTNGTMNVLSAVGVVSTICIRKPTGAYLRFKGSFQIISLSGTFINSSMCNPLGENRMVTAWLVNPERKSFGGSVVGFMIAATPVQIVVACFEPDTSKEKNGNPASPPSFSQSVNPASPSDFGHNVPQPMLGPGTSLDVIPFVP
ncbi:AT-hook motif nuclear-localized protein 2-like [Pyrus x bretschneideri]|uniref:AT-hook motif nuclear-localized protein 2-like n=1 Tax=Pyrus x bretschneideri TaxID=225117 RepID=UPI00202E80F6|nr:AT-hook motif nuclear-localized protein 2-like [Pyrus x bretschneideri]